MYKSINKQSGQVLLITIMLLATLLTVAISISFKTTTDTQISKLEEESQKALAAAESGIENLLQSGATSVAINSLPNYSQFSGSADVVSTSPSKFSSPVVQAGQAYTLYMSDYTAGVGFTGTSYTSGQTIRIYYGTGSVSDCDSMAIELTEVYGNAGSYSFKRTIGDKAGLLTGTSGENHTVINGGTSVDGITFYCRSDITASANSRLVIARLVVGNTTRFGIDGTAAIKSQGKTVVSEAQTTTGVTKRVQLFQSYPQIPADFLMTSF